MGAAKECIVICVVNCIKITELVSSWKLAHTKLLLPFTFRTFLPGPFSVFIFFAFVPNACFMIEEILLMLISLYRNAW